MSCEFVVQSSRATDAAYFWSIMRDLTGAERSGDLASVGEALDDLDLFTLQAAPSAARTRAGRELARRGFYASRQNAG
ncbi:hypothetical protein [Cereibacter johrii]|uniref:hypothetical protein n=1 Tax=Cereibacter johrii TaxID=445629 RepID=UPI000DCC32D3|nr:hypothetical protein [Cereibacter johrii]RAZ86504.1 hypothetical protein DDV93_08885 [Cereibacter johrii]